MRKLVNEFRCMAGEQMISWTLSIFPVDSPERVQFARSVLNYFRRIHGKEEKESFAKAGDSNPI